MTTALDAQQESGKHTPGPWSYDEDGYTVTAGDRRSSICSVEHISISRQWQDEHPETPWGLSEESHRDVPDEEREANARLIAAAPEMLAALKNVQQAFAGIHVDVTDVSAAIAKATGAAL